MSAAKRVGGSWVETGVQFESAMSLEHFSLLMVKGRGSSFSSFLFPLAYSIPERTFNSSNSPFLLHIKTTAALHSIHSARSFPYPLTSIHRYLRFHLPLILYTGCPSQSLRDSEFPPRPSSVPAGRNEVHEENLSTVFWRLFFYFGSPSTFSILLQLLWMTISKLPLFWISPHT